MRSISVGKSSQVDTIQALLAALSQGQDLRASLQHILQAAATWLAAAHGVIYSWDDHAHFLTPRACYGAHTWPDILPGEADTTIVGTVAHERVGLWLPEVSTSAYTTTLPPQVRAVLAEPLCYREHLVGVILLGHEQAVQDLTPAEREVVTLCATYAALAIGQESLEQDRKALATRARQQETIASLGQRALRHTNAIALMQDVVHRVAETLEVQHCAVLDTLADSDAWRISASVGIAPEVLEQEALDFQGDPHVTYTLQAGQAIVVEDLRTETRFQSPCLQRYGVRSCVMVIIHGLGRPFGVLGVYTTTPRRFSPDDVQFLESVANVLAATIERQRLDEHMWHGQKMQAIGTLAGGIAHDFNNILAAMLGYTELVTDDVPRDSIAWRNLQHVLTAGERARDLVQQILAFSRQSPAQFQPVELPALVREMLALLRASLPSTIEIRQYITANVGTVQAAPAQLHQVLLNLCMNAEHAMRATGGVLEVRLDSVNVDTGFAAAHPDLTPGPHVRLTVQDTGHGMAPDILERIYEPFFTTKGVGEGTGMGLAVAHGIVASHGGAMTVVSTPDKGTVFAVYLPCSAVPMVHSAANAEPIPQGSEHILLVDDETMLVELGRELLSRLGYTVTAYTSSPEALAAFHAEPQRFDLVITDQTMPKMTGEALSRAIREMRPDLPIILCTGFSYVMNEEKAAALGIDAFLMKPLIARELGCTIRNVLTQRQQGGSGRLRMTV